MTIQDVILNSGSLINLSRSNEKAVLPFCLDDYELAPQKVTLSEHTKLKERPIITTSTDFSEDHNDGVQDIDFPYIALLTILQSAEIQATPYPALRDTIPASPSNKNEKPAEMNRLSDSIQPAVKQAIPSITLDDTITLPANQNDKSVELAAMNKLNVPIQPAVKQAIPSITLDDTITLPANQNDKSVELAAMNKLNVPIQPAVKQIIPSITLDDAITIPASPNDKSVKPAAMNELSAPIQPAVKQVIPSITLDDPITTPASLSDKSIEPAEMNGLGSVDNSDFDVPRLVRGIQSELILSNESSYYSRSLDSEDKPRNVGGRVMNYQHALDESTNPEEMFAEKTNEWDRPNIDRSFVTETPEYAYNIKSVTKAPLISPSAFIAAHVKTGSDQKPDINLEKAVESTIVKVLPSFMKPDLSSIPATLIEKTASVIVSPSPTEPKPSALANARGVDLSSETMTETEKTDTLVSIDESRGLIDTGIIYGDSLRQVDKSVKSDSDIALTSERSDNVIIRDAQNLSAGLVIDSNKVRLDEKHSDNITLKITEYDAAINSIVSMMNKKILSAEGIDSKNSPNIQSVSRDSYDAVKTKANLNTTETEYKAGDAGVALNVDNYTAKIKIHPPELGKITAEIVINKGLIELTLTAENRSVMDFIEKNMQELHEKLIESSINLSQVTIQDNTTQNKHNFSQRQTSPEWSYDGIKRSDLEDHLDQQMARPSDALIDTYA